MASGATLSFLLPYPAIGARTDRSSGRSRSLLTIWLEGGPSQLESWDPHPGMLGLPRDFAIKTRTPELLISRFYPQTADVIDSLTLIRSLVSREGDHERASYYLKTGYRMDPTLIHPALGARLAHEIPDLNLEIPPFISIGEWIWPARGGFLGARYDAFRVVDSRHGLDNVTSRATSDRQSRRLENLQIVEKAFSRRHHFAESVTLHEANTQDALTLMSSEQLSAFQVDAEPAAIRNSFGPGEFGTGCLLALRLVTAGVRAVEVTLSGFDSHVNNLETQKGLAGTLDPALASLMTELRARDLYDSVVVLVIGEFGRTPQVNALEGRDHWPHGFSCLVGGGGIQEGLVIGSTDPAGESREPEDPIRVNDLHATLLTRFGLDSHQESMTDVGRPMAFSDGTPIDRLLKLR